MATVINSTKVKAPTQKEQFTDIIAILKDSDHPKAAGLVKFCESRIEKLERKATSASAKKTAEDEKFFDAIAEVLGDGSAKRATDIMKGIAPEFADITIQKVTSMLTKMIAAGLVEKTVDKKVSTFSLVFGESED